MNYCSACGGAITLRTPVGDQRPRHVCSVCSTIHYQNPKLVVGAIAQWEDKVLLCRRAIEPRLGFWTLPAGFMEMGESTGEAGMRETLEEAHAQIELGPLYTLVNIPQISQVHLIYRAKLLNLDFSPGEESLETCLLAEHEIPWNDLAFRSISLTLRHYFKDRTAGHFQFREETLDALS